MKKKHLDLLKKIAKNNSLPILDDLLITDGWATASNWDISVSFPCPNIEGTGTVPADIMAKTKFDSGRFIDDHVLELKKGNAVWKLQGQDPEEYPQIPKQQDKICVFKDVDLLHKVLPFASKDDLRPVTVGAYVGKKKITATDAHRLIALKRKSKGLDGTIIPSAVIPFLVEDEYTVYQAADGEKICFFSDEQRVIFRPVDGRYPNYPAVIPEKFKATAIVDTQSLIDALDRALVCANKETHKGNFTFDAKNLTVQSEDLDYNNSYKEKLPVKAFAELVDDNRLTIGLNMAFLKQTLSLYKKEKSVKFYLAEANRAIILNEILQMPVMLESGPYSGWAHEVKAFIDSPIKFTLEEYREFNPDYGKEKPAAEEPAPATETESATETETNTEPEPQQEQPAEPVEEAPIQGEEKIGDFSGDALEEEYQQPEGVNEIKEEVGEVYELETENTPEPETDQPETPETEDEPAESQVMLLEGFNPYCAG